MTLSFTGLPDDILIQIYIRLDPKDFLSIIQTCRVLHAFAFSDYVWHHINHILPLDLSSSQDGRLSSLPASEIQAATIRSLRLDVNWRRSTSQILRIDKIRPYPTAVDVQPLGANWLVTSHRVRGSLRDICIWRLGVPDSSGIIPSSRVIHIKPEQHAFAFQAAFEQEGGGDVAIIVVLGSNNESNYRKGQLTIYQINLKGHETNENPLGIPYVIQTWRIERSEVFYYAQISGPVIAAGIVGLKFPEAPRLHRIILFNVQTRVTVTVDSPAFNVFDSAWLRFKLYSPFIVITGIHEERIKVQVRELPKAIYSSTDAPESNLSADWESSIVDYETKSIRAVEIHISPEPVYSTPLTSFTLLATSSYHDSMESRKANVYRFPIDTSWRNLVYNDWPCTLNFPTPSNTTLEPMCLGITGLRGVWLSHQWNTDTFKLMKASFPPDASGETMVSLLHAPAIALPFEPHTCHSLYFDEAAGKVWVNVHTGEVFVLQF